MRVDATVLSKIGNNPPSQAVWTNVRIPAAVEDTPTTTGNIIQQGILLGGKTSSGEWVDVVVFENWLRNEFNVQTLNLFKSKRKASALDLEAMVYQVLNKGVLLGGITHFDVLQVRQDGRSIYFEWKAQLTNAIHSTTISGIVKP